MKLEVKTPNYCCTVVKLENIYKLENSDNLLGTTFFGYKTIVSKDVKLGELFLFFSTETQLSPSLLYNNNLYSSQGLNIDIDKKGYLDKNGRIRAIKLRGNTSNGLLLPLKSLSYLGINYNELKEGDVFNSINGIEICKKYEIEIKGLEGKNKLKGITKKYERIDGKHFPEHFETDQYFRNINKYKDEDRLIITQKLHGTSVRIGNVSCLIKPTLIDKILHRHRSNYDYIAGSRRVIRDLKSKTVEKSGLDIYNRVLEKYKSVIPKDVIIYGEVIGYSGTVTPIQYHYTYNCAVGEWAFYVYRIVMINKDGLTIDYSREAIKEFCNMSGMNFVPEIEIGLFKEININSYMDLKLSTICDKCLPLSSENTVDEGVCIRKEFINPYITKAKSPLFYEWETKQLDEGVIDLESQQL